MPQEPPGSPKASRQLPQLIWAKATPQGGADQAVNPFWSEHVQRSVQGHDVQAGVVSHQGGQGIDVEMEKLKEKCLRDAEEVFAREVKRLGMAEKTEAESYHTATSFQGAQQKVPNGSGGESPNGPVQAPQAPDPPPGLNPVRIGFDGTVGPTVSESLRHLELPALPVVGHSSFEIG